MIEYIKKNVIFFFIGGVLLSPWLSMFNRTIYSAHLVVLITIVVLFYQKKLVPQILKINRIILVFFIVWFIKLFANGFKVNLIINKFTIIYIFAFLLILTVLCVLDNSEKINYAILLFKWFTVITAIIGLLEVLTPFRLPFSLYMLRDFSGHNPAKLEYLMSQPTAFYFNPNDYATLLTLGLGLFLGNIKSEANKSESIFSIGILTLAILLSNSRGNTIAMILLFGITILTQYDIRKISKISLKKKMLSIFIIVLLLFVLWNPIMKMSKQLIELATSLLTGNVGNSGYASNRERWQITVNAFSMIKNNFFGVGTGIGRKYIGGVMGAESLDMHNWLLEIWGDFGTIFFLLFILFNVWIFVKLIKIARSNRPRTRGLALSLIFSKAALIVAMISPSSLVYFIPYWLHMGIVLSFVNVYSKNKSNIHREVIK